FDARRRAHGRARKHRRRRALSDQPGYRMSANPDSLAARVQRNIHEHLDIAPYDPQWPTVFAQEKAHLLACLPNELCRRIEHFGSTAVPGLAAKPIVDMLVEVTDLEATKTRIVPILESQRYVYFWRPTFGDDTPPWYARCI